MNNAHGHKSPEKILSEQPSNSKLKGKMNSGGVLFGVTIGVSLNLELGVAIMAEKNPEKTLLEHPSKSKLYGERNSGGVLFGVPIGVL